MARGRFVGLLLCAAWLIGDLTPVSGQAYLSDRYSSAPVAPQNAGRVFRNPASVSSRMNEGLPSASHGDYRLNPEGHSLMSGNGVGVASSSCDPVDPCENGLGDPYDPGDPGGLFPRRAVGQCLNADCPPSRLTFRKGRSSCIGVTPVLRHSRMERLPRTLTTP